MKSKDQVKVMGALALVATLGVSIYKVWKAVQARKAQATDVPPADAMTEAQERLAAAEAALEAAQAHLEEIASGAAVAEPAPEMIEVVAEPPPRRAPEMIEVVAEPPPRRSAKPRRRSAA